MKKWRNDFKNLNSSSETYYDLFDDWDLIESSFTQQYGIRLRKEIKNMEWGEFSSLLSGINGETVLGNVVRIRSEKDFETIKKFSTEEKKIRNDWINKHNRKSDEMTEKQYNDMMMNIEKYFLTIGNVKEGAKK